MSHLWGVNTGDPDTLIDGVYWCPGPVPVAHHEGLVVLDQVATLHPLQENYEARLVRSRDATLLALPGIVDLIHIGIWNKIKL